MKASILISLAFLINCISGCSSAPTKTILEERAGYGVNTFPQGLEEVGDVQYVPTRIPEKVVVAWLHAHELPSKDYFWGSWISVLVAPENWVMKKVAVVPHSHQKIKTSGRPQGKPLKPDSHKSQQVSHPRPPQRAPI